jgi:ubiquinone/menaquinone biosynthesis C-methylase UbiE
MKYLKDIYQIGPNESIACIGVGGGLWEVALSFELRNVHFYLNDTNANLLNTKTLDATISYFNTQYGRTTTCTFTICIGSNHSINVPNIAIDKVLLNNCLHEIAEPTAILKECYTALKPNGILIIEEKTAITEGQVHEGCGRALFTVHGLCQLLESTGFKLHWHKEKAFFAFVKSPNSFAAQ